MASRNAVESTFKAKVDTLTNWFQELQAAHHFGKPFLKMDTQGFDLQVLRGGAQCLHHFLGLQSEVSVIPIYEGMPSWKQALAEYEAQGFALSGLYPVSHDEQLRVVEFDALMTRTDGSHPAARS